MRLSAEREEISLLLYGCRTERASASPKISRASAPHPQRSLRQVCLMQECVSELLLFVASAALRDRSRSSLHSEDVVNGLEEVDLDHFARPVRRSGQSNTLK